MSDYTLIAPTPGHVLDLQQVMHALGDMPDVQDIIVTQDHHGRDRVEAKYWRQADKYPYSVSSVGLGTASGSVSIHGSDDGALMFAIEFGKRYITATGTPLDVFNEIYDFHQAVSPDLDLATLNQRIAENSHSGAEASCYKQVKDSPGEDGSK